MSNGKTKDQAEHLRRLEAENANLRAALAVSQEGGRADRGSIRAALNLLEDANLGRELLERTTDALREKDRELIRVQHAGGVAGVNIDIVGGLVGHRSAEYRRLHGLPPEIVHERHEEWQQRLHPEDRERADQALREALAGTAPSYESEYRIIRPIDGEERWILAKADIERDEAGRPQRMIGAHIDITERKHIEEALRASEERLRLVLDSARDFAIFTLDPAGIVTGWNAGGEAIFQYPAEAIIGRDGTEMCLPEDRAAGRLAQEMEIADREGIAASDRWHLRKDGSPFWGSGSLVPLRRGAEGFLMILSDQTKAHEAGKTLEEQRAQLAEALAETEQARAEAEAASAAKDHFLAMLSHELRTPLAPVLTTLKMLSRQAGTSPQMKESLELIRRNIRVEAHLIDDLLDVTRIARGKLEIVPAPMDLHEAIRDAVEITAADLEDKRQQLLVTLSADRHRLTGDAVRLQQAVWNLLKNASKFTPEGGALKISTRNDSGKLLIDVSDNGIGIAEEALLKIFDAFAQGGEEVTRRFGGLGLGLAISKAIVDAHGGNLSVTSPGPGRGSTFLMELPLSGPTK